VTAGERPATQLNYALRRHVSIFTCTKLRCVRLILACWIIPLVAGVTDFLVWLFTRSDSLESFGAFILIVGTIAAAIGVIFAFYFAITDWRRGENPLVETLLPTVLLLVLVGSNFAVASAVMDAVDWVDTHHPTQEQIDARRDAG
jgi:uncharacterized membrane protein